VGSEEESVEKKIYDFGLVGVQFKPLEKCVIIEFVQLEM